MEKHDTAELRALIARCRDEADAASKVALQALRAVEREGRLRANQMRELRSRLSTVAAMVAKSRTR